LSLLLGRLTSKQKAPPLLPGETEPFSRMKIHEISAVSRGAPPVFRPAYLACLLLSRNQTSWREPGISRKGGTCHAGSSAGRAAKPEAPGPQIPRCVSVPRRREGYAVQPFASRQGAKNAKEMASPLLAAHDQIAEKHPAEVQGGSAPAEPAGESSSRRISKLILGLVVSPAVFSAILM
jgi:hypothetical protein